ncbi:MAG: hypothetical protein J2P17_34905, partial [Mycobacterium sp.]|nr:hypothetical protein [Mycobacterium sp.]
MIVFWLLIFVAWEGLRGGARQTTSDARTGLRNARARAKARTAARFRMWDAAVRQRKPYSPVRIGWTSAKAGYRAGAYGIAATRATGRGLRTAHRSWRTGWAEGAQRG